MSTKKPVKQDFIAKVRYINNLPPPPVNPKFIKDNTTQSVSTEEESNQILSSLFRKENFKKLIENVDEEYGMNLNLINNHGVLDNNDYSSIIQKKSGSVELHPNDRALLRDAGVGKISKKEPEVSFLRRTEYISDNKITRSIESDKSDEQVEKFDSETQLKIVEKTFDDAQESLKNFKDLKHPTKKHLKAVRAWQLLPDTSMMDAKFMAIKFSGSASFKREMDNKRKLNSSTFDEDKESKIISTSVFKPITSEDGEWVSLYQNDPNEVDKLHQSLNSLEPNKANNLESEDFNFKFVRNYDMNFTKLKKFEELSIRFDKKRRLANYYPIAGKIELRKYRTSANSQINKFVNDSVYDVINYKLREPNTDEMRKMDNIRSEFDPMEYEGEDEEKHPEEPSSSANDKPEDNLEDN